MACADYLCILNFLKEYSGSDYHSSKNKDLTGDEVARYSDIFTKGQCASKEFKKIVEFLCKKFTFINEGRAQWTNPSGTKVRSYMWIRFKKQGYEMSNINISLFVEEPDAETARFRVSLEIKNSGNSEIASSKKGDYLQFHSHFDKPLQNGLVYVAGSNENGNLEILNEDAEITKMKVSAGEYDKVQVSKIIGYNEADSNDDYENAIIQGFEAVVPYYDYVMSVNVNPSPAKYTPNYYWLDSQAKNLGGWLKDKSIEIDYISREKFNLINPGDMCIVYESVTDNGRRSLVGTSTVIGKKMDGTNTIIMGSLTKLANDVHFDDIPEDLKKELAGAAKPLNEENLKATTKGTIYKIDKSQYDKLISLSLKESPSNTKTVEQMISDINKYISEKGFIFPENLVANFYLCLKSKPFVILAGTSGTGKTRLVKLFAEALGATKDNGRFLLVPVRPDWSDSSDLFGHVDLEGNFVQGPVIDLLAEANKSENKDKPYFICLDEMNLARVEYYLSDFLSVIETRDFKGGIISTDNLVTESLLGAKSQYKPMPLPSNVYVVGTVNMDETTFPFSKKVLDRANTIEFNFVELDKQYDVATLTAGAASPSKAATAQEVANAFLESQYLTLDGCAQKCAKEKNAKDLIQLLNDVNTRLSALNKVLENANAHVGYRVRDEIAFYMVYSQKDGEILTKNVAFDNCILQKILPRINGSSVAVKNLLADLYAWLTNPDNILGAVPTADQGKDIQLLFKDTDANKDKNFKERLDADVQGCAYEASARKVAYMYRRFEDDGFTSYWL